MTDLVFISHSNADKGVADAICAELERAGIRCWIAPRDITPGRMWGEAIIDGINASRVMILIHSRRSNKSPQVIREVERAVNRRLLLLQVRMEEIKPSRALELFIASSQWLNAFPGPIDSYLSSLPGLVRNLLEEAVETGEHTADHTAEQTADHTADHTAEYATLPPSPAEHPPLPADRTPSHAAHAPADTPRVVVDSKTRRTSRGMVVSLAMALGIVVLAGAWALTQMNRGQGAVVPETVARNSGIDTSLDSVAKDAKTAKDSVVHVLRVTATATTYRIGERFTLRAETNDALSLRWRSGDNSIIGVRPDDSVFRAIAVGSAYVFAENATLRDSVRIKVVSKAQTGVAAGKETTKGTSVASGSIETKAIPAAPASRDTSDRTPTRAGSPPILTDSMAGARAGDCTRAIEKPDAAWVRAHYGSPLTVDDVANLKALESIFKKRGYRAILLQRAKYAGNAVTFSMRLEYAGGFGPKLSVDIPFDVRMVNGQAQGELEHCRARGAVSAP